MMYFESLKTYLYNDYLGSTPHKKDVIENARKSGHAYILPNSNNRAVVIEDGNKLFLQSYDTLIIEFDKETGTIKKLWDGYSKTTLKHVNDFLYPLTKQTYSKKEWIEL